MCRYLELLYSLVGFTPCHYVKTLYLFTVCSKVCFVTYRYSYPSCCCCCFPSICPANIFPSLSFQTVLVWSFKVEWESVSLRLFGPLKPKLFPPHPISQCYLGWFVDPGLAGIISFLWRPDLAVKALGPASYGIQICPLWCPDPHWGGFRWEQKLSFSNPPDLMSFRVGPPPLGEVLVLSFLCTNCSFKPLLLFFCDQGQRDLFPTQY